MDYEALNEFQELFKKGKQATTIEEKMDIIAKANALKVTRTSEIYSNYEPDCPKPNKFILDLIKTSGHNPEHYKNKKVMPGVYFEYYLFLFLDEHEHVKVAKNLKDVFPCFSVHNMYGLAGDGILIDLYSRCFGTAIS